MVISDAPGTTGTPRAHLLNMAGLGKDAISTSPGPYLCADPRKNVCATSASRMTAFDSVTAGKA